MCVFLSDNIFHANKEIVDIYSDSNKDEDDDGEFDDGNIKVETDVGTPLMCDKCTKFVFLLCNQTSVT